MDVEELSMLAANELFDAAHLKPASFPAAVRYAELAVMRLDKSEEGRRCLQKRDLRGAIDYWKRIYKDKWGKI